MKKPAAGARQVTGTCSPLKGLAPGPGKAVKGQGACGEKARGCTRLLCGQSCVHTLCEQGHRATNPGGRAGTGGCKALPAAVMAASVSGSRGATGRDGLAETLCQEHTHFLWAPRGPPQEHGGDTKAGTSLRDPAFLSQPSMPGGLPGVWPKLPLAVPNPFTWNQACRGTARLSRLPPAPTPSLLSQAFPPTGSRLRWLLEWHRMSQPRVCWLPEGPEGEVLKRSQPFHSPALCPGPLRASLSREKGDAGPDVLQEPASCQQYKTSVLVPGLGPGPCLQH